MRDPLLRAAAALLILSAAAPARADAPLEPVERRVIQKGETCADLARSLWGDAKRVDLLSRYQSVACPRPRAGDALVVPKVAGALPLARIASVESADASTRALQGTVVSQAFRLELGASDRVVLELHGARVALGPKTRASLDAEGNQVVLTLEAGELSSSGERPVVVAFPGGGRATLTSKDAWVERRGERATVAVHEGKAALEGAKKQVALDAGKWSRLEGKGAPAAARPVGAARELTASLPIAFAGEPLELRWEPPLGATGHRVEVSREDGGAFAAQDLPGGSARQPVDLAPGRYVARLRSRDADDVLGAASERRFVVLGAAAGKLTAAGLEVHPYGRVELEPSGAVEVSLDGRDYIPFDGPITGKRLVTGREKALWLRAPGGAPRRVPLTFASVEVDVAVKRTKDGLEVRVTFPGLPEGGWEEVRPKLQGVGEEGPPAALGDVPIDGALAVDRRDLVELLVVDDAGRVLARRPVPRAPPPPAAQKKEPEQYPGVTGLTADLPTDQPGPWLAPLPRPAGLVGVMVSSRQSGAVTVALYTYGAFPIWGPLAIDALVQSPGLDAPGAEAYAAPGLRVRALKSGDFQLGAGARVYFPIIENGPPVRIEPTIALGGFLGHQLSLLGNVGVRFRVGNVSFAAPVPDVNPFATFGLSYDVNKWLRAFGVGDFAVLLEEDGNVRARGGARAGLEAGTDIFAHASGYVGSGAADDLHASGVLAVGFRR